MRVRVRKRNRRLCGRVHKCFSVGEGWPAISDRLKLKEQKKDKAGPAWGTCVSVCARGSCHGRITATDSRAAIHGTEMVVSGLTLWRKSAFCSSLFSYVATEVTVK